MLECILSVSVTAGICMYGCMYVCDGYMVTRCMYACVCVGMYESFSVVLQCHLQPLGKRAAQSRWPNASSGLPLTLAVGSESASSAHFSCVCVPEPQRAQQIQCKGWSKKGRKEPGFCACVCWCGFSVLWLGTKSTTPLQSHGHGFKLLFTPVFSSATNPFTLSPHPTFTSLLTTSPEV